MRYLKSMSCPFCRAVLCVAKHGTVPAPVCRALALADHVREHHTGELLKLGMHEQVLYQLFPETKPEPEPLPPALAELLQDRKAETP